ncbi:MAG: four-carbon acid sugar kinase family protein [Synergistaceae bacterium]|nr:four-carbon acid sugar kinase family protein [Synergistaceae bacterium]
MPKLLIIADDFTGALDTGVQFSSRGARTKVITDFRYDFSRADGLDVLVFDSETRHLAAEKAYGIINDFVKRAASKFSYIYKKTDSGLRGNIGSELAAAMDALNFEKMAFIPAFPEMNRITKNGVHYIDGVPVAESVFGKDPFEPVKNSDVKAIIAEQTNKTGIQIYDSESNDDMKKIADSLGAEGLRLTAGCAGFAEILASKLGFNGKGENIAAMPERFFLICGSVNPVTQKQMDYAEAHGFKRICLSVEQKLNENWPESQECEQAAKTWLKEIGNSHAILDANNPSETQQTEEYIKSHNLNINQVRIRISNAITSAAKALLDNGLEARLMCVGGDTLLALMQYVGVHELIPICEIEKGVVLTNFTYNNKNYNIMTKSGGFGDEDLLVKIADYNK